MSKQTLEVNGAELNIFGKHDDKTVKQMTDLMQHGSVVQAALLPDGHFGYSQPIGGTVAYSEHVSVSGVGFDIGCGVRAVKTDIKSEWMGDLFCNPWLEEHRDVLADQIASHLSFGVGRVNTSVPDQWKYIDSHHGWWHLGQIAGKHETDRLRTIAKNQLSTVGGGNHYVNIMQDGNGHYWVTAHFGSRGLGHSIASGFMKLAKGLKWDDKLTETDEPLLLDSSSDLGRAYLGCMDLAAEYAERGREAVTESVLDILGTQAMDVIDNHHNYSFEERYAPAGNSSRYVHVARKGSTPINPLVWGVVGGSMCDDTVILSGKKEDRNELGLTDTISSTVHGAGRVMSRMEAKGKRKWKTGELVLDDDGNPKRPGKVTPEMMFNAVREADVTLRGGDLDESPFVYRKLKDVLADCPNVNIEAVLKPKIVLMAPSGVQDPYKD